MRNVSGIDRFSCELGKMTEVLLPYARKLTNGFDDAHDLVQETLYKAYSNRAKFTEGTNLKAWVYTIMRNTFITNYQKEKRSNIVTQDEITYLHHSKNTYGVNNQVYSQFTLNDIEFGMNELLDIYRRPISMYFGGFKYHEIADELGIPMGTVKNRIHMARKELQDKLKVYKTAS